MGTRIKVECKSCGHTFYADYNWAKMNLPGETYNSSTSIECYLIKNKRKLKCKNCDTNNPMIMQEQPQENKRPKLADNEKVYINEGIAGTREDNKKMRGHQWSANVKNKF